MLDVFKSKIRQQEPDCPCRLHKNYLQHVNFIQFSINYFFKSTSNIMYIIRFEPMLLLCFYVFRILAAYVDISGTNCNMNQSPTQSLGVSRSIGAKYIKFLLEFRFFIHTSMFTQQVPISNLVLIVDVNWLLL